jgi:hypothetical protein
MSTELERENIAKLIRSTLGERAVLIRVSEYEGQLSACLLLGYGETDKRVRYMVQLDQPPPSPTNDELVEYLECVYQQVRFATRELEMKRDCPWVQVTPPQACAAWRVGNAWAHEGKPYRVIAIDLDRGCIRIKPDPYQEGSFRE